LDLRFYYASDAAETGKVCKFGESACSSLGSRGCDAFQNFLHGITTIPQTAQDS
jgi:hypothetical protein